MPHRPMDEAFSLHHLDSKTPPLGGVSVSGAKQGDQPVFCSPSEIALTVITKARNKVSS